MEHAVDPRGTKLIVLTEDEYRDLIEDAGDAALAAQVMAGNAPAMPADLLKASLDGTLHPLAAWRKAAGLTQVQLAAKAGLRPASISDIEGGKIDPRLSTLKALADALGLGVEDIVD